MTNETDPTPPPQNSPQRRGHLYLLLSAFSVFLFGVLASRKRIPIAKGVDPDNSPDEVDNQQQESDRKVVHIVAVEPYPSPTPTDKENSYRTRKELREWGVLVVEVIGLVGLIFYACTTFKMWREMQVQTGIQGSTAKNAERAWVGLERVPEVEVSSLEPNNFHAVIRLEGKNFGKGPALKVIADARIVTSNVDNNIQSSCNLIFPFVGLKPKWPSISSDESTFRRQWGQAVFPNQDFSTITNYSGGNVLDVTGKEAYIIGCIVYKDQFSDPHWTKFCYNTGDFAPQVVRDASSFKHLYACNTNNYTDEMENK